MFYAYPSHNIPITYSGRIKGEKDTRHMYFRKAVSNAATCSTDTFLILV